MLKGCAGHVSPVDELRRGEILRPVATFALSGSPCSCWWRSPVRSRCGASAPRKL